MIVIGEAPYLECSASGNLYLTDVRARPISLHGRSIADALSVHTSQGHYSSWVKNRRGLLRAQKEFQPLYSALWDEWIAENPELKRLVMGAEGFSDKFSRYEDMCAVKELWRIRTAPQQRLI